jgi:GNAT superfamily N-acetyltransferase
MEINIKVFEPPYNKTEFYEHMGDVFSMKTVRRELPYLSNDPSRVWFLAFSGNDLAGFCSLQESETVVDLLCDYVCTAYRGKGVYTRLVDTRMKYASKYNKPMKIICCGDIFAEMYHRRGFVEVRRTINYRFLTKEIHDAT